MIDFQKLSTLLSTGEVDCKEVEELIELLAINENWLPIYLISESVTREVSILIDAEGKIWVDWGDVGEVKLNPPVGSILPFKLWIHTHPRSNAYWSPTDRNSLAIASGILDRALVLGKNGILSTSKCEFDKCSVNGHHTNQWTEESVRSWFEIVLCFKEEVQ